VTTHVERSIEVAVPVRTAYDQWTRFEEFPRFMSGVEEVRQVGDAMTHWVAQIAGVRREWDAAIVEQLPDEKVAWAATTGATNAGAVFFDSVATDRTRVRLTLDYEPEGVVERVGDVLDVVQRQAVADLDRFKEFIEGQGSAAGGWRGTIEDGDVMSQGTPGQMGARTPDDVPGDVVAVGPTGDTESTLTTEPDSAPSTAPAADYDAIGHSGDPVAVDPNALRATDEPWAPGGSGPGEDRGVRDTAAEGVVGRNFADESITTEDVVARDFANRDISGEGVVERDFANRDVTERDIANRGITPETAGAPMTELSHDAPIAQRAIKPESAGAPVAEPTSLDAADDPDNPIRPRV
jgi:hypothetical protein